MKKAPVLSGKTAMPKGKPWPKGQSGNPGGRPKKFTTLIGDAFCQQLAEIDSATGKPTRQSSALNEKAAPKPAIPLVNRKRLGNRN